VVYEPDVAVRSGAVSDIGRREVPGMAISSGILKFNGGFESELGAYQACSIFAVMGEFSNQEQARTAAQTVCTTFFPRKSKSIPNLNKLSRWSVG